MKIVIVCKMTPISVRLNLKNFILISCAVLELLRKVSQGGGSGEIGLKKMEVCLENWCRLEFMKRQNVPK